MSLTSRCSPASPRTVPAGERRSGFTLVELLVVIGIIALLISILLPTLGKAREASVKAKCLSNLKQIATMLRVYAADNKDACPIGVVATPATNSAGEVIGITDTPQLAFNYTIYWVNGSNQRDMGLGLLARSKIATSGPQVFYCPTITNDRTYLFYNASDNLWNYGPNAPQPASRTNTRIGYMMRPAAGFPAVDAASSVRGAESAYLIEGNYPLATGQKFPSGYPRFSKLKNKAILADLARDSKDVKMGHREGVNVAFADSSATWVANKEFEEARGGTASGPFGGGSAIPWKGLDITSPSGNASPPTDVASNGAYYTKNPIFPGGSVTVANSRAGIWNWFDRKTQ